MSFFKQKISEELFQKKYMLHGEKDVKEVFNLVAEEVSSVESDRRWKDIFYEEMISGRLIPAGRILANARPNSPMKNFNNCYTIGIEDSMDGIADSLKEYMTILKSGGGVGFNISNLRPKEALISTGGSSSGAISFLKIFNSAGGTLHTGGGRRGASICIMNIDHPDIEEFITCKQGDKNKELTQFNISVGITEKFITAVKENKDWDLVFNNKVYKTVKAKSLYNLLCKNAFVHNEPGIFNLDIVNKYNNGFYLFDIAEVNPCLSGDTLVAVADGRNAVTIKELAEANKDVPVYCKDDDNKLTVRTMRNPRITGYNQNIYEVKIEDGSVIKCTENHKFLMKDGSYKEAKNLLQGDSLHVSSKYKTTFEEMLNSKSHSRSCQEYWRISDNNKSVFEHRFLYETFNKTKTPKHCVIHHKNVNGLDNSFNNLEMMTKQEHDKHHTISGDNNPMRKWWKNATTEEKERYSNNMSIAVSGKNNPMYGKRHTKETKEKIGFKAKKRSEDVEYIKFLSNAISNKMSDPEIKEKMNQFYKARAINYLKECQSKTDLKCIIIDDTKVRVIKKCELCNKTFLVKFRLREQAYCSSKCCMKITSQKSGVIARRKAKLRHSKYQSLIIDLFSKFVNQHKKIPVKSEFLKFLNKNNINDLRTAGFPASYNKFLENIFDGFNISSVSVQAINKNINDCQFEKAKELIDSGMIYNHKIVSVKMVGKDVVYNGTVDEFHNFNIIFNKTKTEFGKDKFLMCNNLQCGEISMEKYSVCCLSSINLSEFIINPFEEDVSLNFKQLVKTIEIGVRFLDNVLDVTEYPLEKIKENSKKRRRIGLGFTGYADMLIKHNMKYGSTEANKLTELIAKAFRDVSYLTSCNLAIEKGVFPDYSKEYLDSDFVKNLPKQLIRKIKHNGIRNIGLNTCAPSGTISLTVGNNCSSGIEPVFSFEYDRKIRTGRGDETKTERVYDNVYLEFKEKYPNKELNDNFINVFDISVKDQIEVQSIWQKYIDHSISKTSNLPKEYTLEDYKELFLFAYKKGLKGFTTFNPGGCGSPDTMVLTTEGIKSFGEIFEAEGIDIFDEQNKGWVDLKNNLEFYNKDGDVCRINKAFIKGLTSNMLNITLENGDTLCVSPEHKFMVGGEWIEAKNLNTGSDLDVYKGNLNKS